MALLEVQALVKIPDILEKHVSFSSLSICASASCLTLQESINSDVDQSIQDGINRFLIGPIRTPWKVRILSMERECLQP